MGAGLLGNGTKPGIIDVKAMFDSGIPNEVATIVEMGILVSIGTTRDRGALSITVTHDGDWDREYFRSSDEAVDWLRRAAAILRERGLGVPETDGVSVPKPTRRRSRLA